MAKKKIPKEASLEQLTQHMLESVMPTEEDPRDCLMALGVQPTCAAVIVFGMIQKAAKGDTSAAKFIKELNGEGPSDEEISEKTDLRTCSDVVLYRLAGLKLQEMLSSEG